MPSDIDTLILKLEQAAEGSRELDARIDWLVRRPHFAPFPQGWDRERAKREGHLPPEEWGKPMSEDDCIAANISPPYTRSLDAALTLVPERFCGHVYFGLEPVKQSANVNCFISGGDGPRIWEDHTGYGWTSAIALCIAALKARRQQAPSQ